MHQPAESERVINCLRVDMSVTVQDKKKTRPWALNFNKRPSDRQELLSPPGFASSVAAFHAEEKRETDPSLVTKVCIMILFILSCY